MCVPLCHMHRCQHMCDLQQSKQSPKRNNSKMWMSGGLLRRWRQLSMFPMHARVQNMHKLIKMRIMLNLPVPFTQHCQPLSMHHKILRLSRHMHPVRILLCDLYSINSLPDVQFDCKQGSQSDFKLVCVQERLLWCWEWRVPKMHVCLF